MRLKTATSENCSIEFWSKKYRIVFPGPDGYQEPTRLDTFRRIARALADAESVEDRPGWEVKFQELLSGFRFLPAGRILAGAGAQRNVTLFNCFVMDTIEDSMGDIFRNCTEAALTMQQGGGIGHDFSTIRPKGMLVKGVGSDASGPLSFMDVWDATCRTIMSAGVRRGAMMATMRCDHPDIEDFISAKHDPARLRNFNVSVLVTDAFMAAVENDGKWGLKFNGRIFRTVSARELWQKIIRNCYDYAEPGVIFIDRINRENNLYYCEDISATNPCGEQPLPPYGACLLGSIVLPQYVRDPFSPHARFDYEQLIRDVPVAVRMLDNVIDVSKFPLPAQQREAYGKRRMGIGVTGLGSALAMLGLRYNSEDGIKAASNMMKELNHTAYVASAELAKERGVFAHFSMQEWEETPMCRSLPEVVRDYIRECGGLRNSHLTSVAPTGTMSLFAGNVSSGVEPIFALSYKRKVVLRDGSKQDVEMQDFAYSLFRDMFGDGQPLPDSFVTVADLTPKDHVRMQAALQRHCDSSISKTVNVPVDYHFEDFMTLYRDAYDQGCKGCTAYRPNDVTGSVLSTDNPHTEESAPAPKLVEREDTLTGRTYRIKWPQSEHAIYITINDIEHEGIKRPYEIFITSKNTDHYAWTVALTRMISAIFRREMDLAFVVEELKAVFDPNGGAFYKGRYTPSLLAAIGGVVQMHLKGLGFMDADVAPTTSAHGALPQCPKCHEFSIVRAEGCDRCISCDYSKCG